MNGSPRTSLIIGCGHFGSRAAEKLLKKDPLSKIIVADKIKESIKKICHLPVETAVGEGVSYLNQFLSQGRRADYIIPAVPFHLAFEFILSRLKPSGGKRKKVPPLSGLPNSIKGKTGDLYTSLADFICSEDCPEPAQYCTFTKSPRPKPLYQILKDIEGPFESKVIRSLQLAPGVGGFKPDVLLGLLKNIEKRTKPHWSILISTASRCHGVTSALSF
jgi:hypothetical protein